MDGFIIGVIAATAFWSFHAESLTGLRRKVHAAWESLRK